MSDKHRCEFCTGDLTLEQRVGAELHELAEAIAAHGIRAKNDACARTAFTVIALCEARDRAKIAGEIRAMKRPKEAITMMYAGWNAALNHAAKRVARGDNSGVVKGAVG